MAFQHGVRVQEQATSLVAPILGTAGLQVVFGTAPVNLAEDPYSVTNTPVIAYSWAEAVKKLGYSQELNALGHHKYTLCEAMYASFKLAAVAPVIFVNVLDPAKHKKEESKEFEIAENQIVLPLEAIAESVKIEGKEIGKDFEAFYNDTNCIVEFVEELPKTISGKIRRVQIRNEDQNNG